MTTTGRLIGGPADGQTVLIEADTVEYIDPEPEDSDSLTYYVYAGTDADTGEHIFRWNRL